jgi:hypothetical protein
MSDHPHAHLYDPHDAPHAHDRRAHSRRIAATAGHPFECLTGCYRCELDALMDEAVCPACETTPCLCDDGEGETR